MPTQTCFESSKDALVISRVAPGLFTSAHTFSEWLKEQAFAPPEIDRLGLAKTFTKTSLPAEAWLKTIEFLRNALILNREQVTFCFSQLPNTSKNRLLRDCFNFYLDSPLAQDSMAQIWELIGQFKTHSFHPKTQDSIRLIPSSTSRYLFKEFCEASQADGPSSMFQIYPISSLCPSDAAEVSEVVHGNRIDSLERLCQCVAQEAKLNSEQSIAICFSGTQKSKSYLRNRLASYGFLIEDLTEETPNSPSEWSCFLTQLRKSTTLSFHKKMELSEALIHHPPYFKESLEDYFERLHSLSVINANQLNLLKDPNSLTPVISSPAIQRKIYLVSWIPLPRFPNTAVWAFSDEALLAPPEQNLLLSETELEALYFAGFHLPRWSETLFSRKTTLAQLSSFHPGHVFTSLSLEHLDHVRTREIETKVFSVDPFQKSESFTADLPIRSLSATQLETYAQCPSKYLYRRMKLNERSTALSDFALQFGQAVHLTLETLHSRPDVSQLDESLLIQTFEESLTLLLSNRKTFKSLSVVFRKAFDKLIPRILETETHLKRLFKPLRTLAVEKEFQVEVGDFSYVGKIDRIDLLPNQHLLILDYKTGNVDFTPDHVAKGTNFQALLYWIGAEKATGTPPAAMLFYDLKKGELKRGLARQEFISSDAKKELTRGHSLNDEKLNKLLADGRESLESFSRQILEGNFAPAPSSDSCRFCEAYAFCRMGIQYV